MTREGRMRTTNLLRLVAATCALALTAAACGDGAGTGGDGERSIVRFAFSPDPVIDWMNDEGIIPEYEERYNVRLVTTSTWDEFTFFAGGHGDIVSMATYETPLLEQETGVDTVTFGSYNNLRVPVFVRSDTPPGRLPADPSNAANPGLITSSISRSRSSSTVSLSESAGSLVVESRRSARAASA
jgi:hypothetical protein